MELIHHPVISAYKHNQSRLGNEIADDPASLLDKIVYPEISSKYIFIGGDFHV
jgi:hypothetical protein